MQQFCAASFWIFVSSNDDFEVSNTWLILPVVSEYPYFSTWLVSIHSVAWRLSTWSYADSRKILLVTSDDTFHIEDEQKLITTSVLALLYLTRGFTSSPTPTTSFSLSRKLGFFLLLLLSHWPDIPQKVWSSPVVLSSAMSSISSYCFSSMHATHIIFVSQKDNV